MLWNGSWPPAWPAGGLRTIYWCGLAPAPAASAASMPTSTLGCRAEASTLPTTDRCCGCGCCANPAAAAAATAAAGNCTTAAASTVYCCWPPPRASSAPRKPANAAWAVNP